MTLRIVGPRSWKGSRDSEGHREYRIVHRVESTTALDGPHNVLLDTPELPAVGSEWDFDDDQDQYAFCHFDATVTPVMEGEPNRRWDVEQVFSTRGQRCHHGDNQYGPNHIDDPLIGTMKITGSFTKYSEEATTAQSVIARDGAGNAMRTGTRILNSAHEMIRGPLVEFDAYRHVVRIEQNVTDLQLDRVESMLNTVNDAEMWGLPTRCIKLSGFSWERKYRADCVKYWTRTFELETFVRLDADGVTQISGFDRQIMDEGAKMLKGNWVGNAYTVDAGADPDNPSHFVLATGRDGNPARTTLNGEGIPSTGDTSTGRIDIQYYRASNFALLNIPTSLEAG